MYSIKVEAYFSAAHNLRAYKGRCEELHGHNWKVEIEILSQNLDKAGMVLDFQFLKKELHKVVDKLDHKYLNNIAYFKKNNPTSELIAKYIYDNLKVRVAPLMSVRVWESDNSSATYYGE
jgi:6-pyruvoyltetrahydropterin/6-carboxytetrahydropterin synthase